MDQVSEIVANMPKDFRDDLVEGWAGDPEGRIYFIRTHYDVSLRVAFAVNNVLTVGGES